ncbi:MAG: GAF domain-containing protein [Chloroflexaceae bacterium]|nr:GAF domain-containing protein [Chloroflexaceae bacterium]
MSMTPQQLAEIMELQQEQFLLVAEAWVAAGAKQVSLWSGETIVAQYPANGSAPALTEHELVITAPLMRDNTSIGELRVYGVDSPERNIPRLNADANLLLNLVNLEGELDMLTAAFVENQDQLLAVYELSRLTRNQLDLPHTLQALANQTRRLTLVDGCCAMLVNNDYKHVAWTDPPLLDNATMLKLFRRFQESRGAELHLYTDTSYLQLPSGIRSIFVEPIYIRGEIVAAIGLFKSSNLFSSPEMKLIRVIG